MNLQQDLETNKNSTLCPHCTTFYGSKPYDGLCSSCYKYLQSYSGKQHHPKRKK
jgi:hypothetical protein